MSLLKVKHLEVTSSEQYHVNSSNLSLFSVSVNGNKDISKVKSMRCLTVAEVLIDKVSHGNYSKNNH